MKKTSLFTALLMAAAMAVTGCADNSNDAAPDAQNQAAATGNETESSEQAVQEVSSGGKDELIVGFANSVDNIDPHGQTSAHAGQIVRQVYDNLVMRDENLEIVPMLAESYEVVDAQTINFKLREGVYFHNGEELTASDVLFSLKRGVESAFSSSMLSFIDPDASEIIDDYNFVLKMAYPFAPALANLTHPSGGIMNEKYVNEVGDRIATEPCGTGAFMVTKFVSGDRIEFDAYEGYFMGKPNVSKMTIRFLIEGSIRSIAIEAGDVDIALDIATSDINRLESNDSVVLERAPSVLVNWMAMNVSKTPLDDPRVRIAIAHALDVEELAKAVYSNTGKVATGALASSAWAYYEQPIYEYDVEKARELLAEAGYADSLSLSIMTDENQARVDTAEIMQNMLGMAGINVEVNIVERAKYLEDMANGSYDITLAGWNPHTGDPDHAFFSKFHTDNIGAAGNSLFYSNPELDKYIDLGRTTVDEDLRLEYYEQVQKIIKEDCPIVPIQEGEWIHSRRTDVKGYYVHPLGSFRYFDIYF